MNNDELIKKTIDTTELIAGGKLLGDQAAAFIDLTVDVSRMLKMVRHVQKTIPHGEMDTINVGAPVTELALEDADSGNLYTPTFGKITYTVKKLRSAFNITTEAYQDNIEHEGLRATTMRTFAKRIAVDHEYLAIEGDETITGNTVTDRLLKANQGWYQQTKVGQGCHYVLAGGARCSLKLFNAMIKSMPSKYKMSRSDLVFFVSPSVYQDYWDERSDRQTSLGDRSIDREIPMRAYGIPVVEIPLIPEDLTVDAPYKTDGTFIWLTIPQNFIYITLRMFDVYWEFKPRKDNWENTTYSQVDYVIENKDAIVMAVDISVSGSKYT